MLIITSTFNSFRNLQFQWGAILAIIFLYILSSKTFFFIQLKKENQMKNRRKFVELKLNFHLIFHWSFTCEKCALNWIVQRKEKFSHYHPITDWMCKIDGIKWRLTVANLINLSVLNSEHKQCKLIDKHRVVLSIVGLFCPQFTLFKGQSDPIILNFKAYSADFFFILFVEYFCAFLSFFFSLEDLYVQ